MCNNCSSYAYPSGSDNRSGTKRTQRDGRWVAYEPTTLEHLANIATHAVLILPSLKGLRWMLKMSADARTFAVCLLYGGSMFALFSLSTMFHLLAFSSSRHNKLRWLLHLCDRGIIYIFIAASYTPWLTLKEYHNASPSVVLALVWLAAVFGIVYQCFYYERYKWLDIFFYLSLGVMPAIVTLQMKSKEGVVEMAVGGATYITGIVFFKMDGRLNFAHAIWHCFVSLGAYVHYRAVCGYLLALDGSSVA